MPLSFDFYSFLIMVKYISENTCLFSHYVYNSQALFTLVMCATITTIAKICLVCLVIFIEMESYTMWYLVAGFFQFVSSF